MLNKLKKLSVIHPFLFALFPVLFLFAHNIYEVSAADLLLPILVVIVGTLILFFSLRLITKNYVKAGIITSFFLILFFSYGHIRGLIYSLDRFDAYNPGDQTGINLFLASLWVVLFIPGVFLVIKSRRDFRILTKFLNVAAVTLVAISLINISIYEIKTINIGQDEINEESSLSSSENLPDIYYIILDEYARADTLAELYNYDNSEFIDYLARKGFYIASRSRCNYAETKCSIASCLNMEYLTEKSITGIFEMFQNNKVSQFLKSKGYRYIFISGVFYEKGMSKYADVYRFTSPIGMNHFTSCLIRSTALAPFAAYFISSDEWPREQVLYSFDTLAGMPNIEGPKFVFAHIICPHGPFVFDRNGNPVTPPKWKGAPDKEWREKYLDFLLFGNKKIEECIGQILSKSDIPPIIIVQADHGPRWDEGRQFDILNAYFLPENGNGLLYETITPVNSFRIVFNLYFDTNYDLLEDKSYFSQGESHYKFLIVPPETE